MNSPFHHKEEENSKVWTDCELAEELATFRGKISKSHSEHNIAPKPPSQLIPMDNREKEIRNLDHGQSDVYVNGFVRKIIYQTVAGIN